MKYRTRTWSNRMSALKTTNDTARTEIQDGKAGVMVEPTLDGHGLRVWMTGGTESDVYKRLLGEVRQTGLLVPAFYPGENLADATVDEPVSE